MDINTTNVTEYSRFGSICGRLINGRSDMVDASRLLLLLPLLLLLHKIHPVL